MAIAEPIAPVVVDAVKSNDGSYMDWPAVLAGTVLASAISLVLLTFGSAIGLSLTSAREDSGASMTALAIAIGLWFIWVQVSGSLAGGYLAGRLRRRNFDASEHESDIRDGAHGLTVWAVGILIGAVIAFSGVSAAVSTATSAVGGAASAAVASAGDLADGGGLMVDRLFRGGTAAGESDPAAQRAEIGRIFVSSVTSGTLEDADRQYIIDTVAARTGLPPADVEARVDQAWTQAQQVEATARETAETARKVGILAAFATAVSLLVAGAAAYYGAVLGGNHRDKQTVFEGWSSPLR